MELKKNVEYVMDVMDNELNDNNITKEKKNF